MITRRRRQYAGADDDNRDRSGAYGQTRQRYQQDDEDYSDEDYDENDDDDYDDEEGGNVKGQGSGDYDEEDYDEEDDEDYDEDEENRRGSYRNVRGEYDRDGR